MSSDYETCANIIEELDKAEHSIELLEEYRGELLHKGSAVIKKLKRKLGFKNAQIRARTI